MAVIRSSRQGAGAFRGGRGLLAAAGLAVALCACNAGQEAQTAFQNPTIDGANGGVDDIAVRAATIAYPEGGRYARGDAARLEFVLVNTGDRDDALVEVRTDAAERVRAGAEPTESATPPATTSSPAATSATPTPTPTGTGTATASGSPSGSATSSPTPSAAPTTEAPLRIEVPAGSAVACRDKGPTVTLVGLTAELLSAEAVQVTFVFERAGEVTMAVPVAVPLSEVSPPPTIDVEPTEGG